MKKIQETTLSIKILSNNNRFMIMESLFNTKENLCVNEIAKAIKISQSLASHQLAYLEAYGIVKGHRIGQTMCYMPTKTSLAKKIGRIIKLLK